MDLELAGKIVFVAGASRGIGAATARLFAQEGADVLVGYHRSRAAAERTAEEVHKASRQAWLVELDVGEPASVASAMKEVTRLVRAIDVAVLCAGTNSISPLLETPVAEWDEVLRVNLNGTFYLLREVVPLLREPGAIVTVSSVAGHTGAAHHAHYAAAKAGVVNLTKSAAKALAPGIRVNCVAPGLTETEMGKQAIGEQDEDYLKRKLLAQRMASPDEIARTIVFLASPAASFIYGATLDVNGGRDLR
ncbi:MAG TPA: SDR family NAD(P)-dependent oxidoreductase [Pirellulales bacterium]|nr:SDR family NAD(P)-dependent oxidoreductase [Pirellulales bacterium]